MYNVLVHWANWNSNGVTEQLRHLQYIFEKSVNFLNLKAENHKKHNFRAYQGNWFVDRPHCGPPRIPVVSMKNEK